MERAAFRISIRPDRFDDYLAAHRDVWPELLAALGRAGIRNYTIFHDGTQVFGYYEGHDLDAAEQAMATEEVNARWQAAMAPLVNDQIRARSSADGCDSGDRNFGRVRGVGPNRLPEIFRLD